MRKPTLRVVPPSELDTDLCERIVRALQDNSLHVVTLYCLAADPRQPDNEAACIVLIVSAVTDGIRGFLVMSEDFAAPSSDVELAEFMEGIYAGAARGDDYVTAVATIYKGGERTPGLLDLTDGDRARSVIEAAYQRAFEGKPAIDHAVMIEHFARLGMRASDEAEQRDRCRDLDTSGPDPADWADGTSLQVDAPGSGVARKRKRASRRRRTGNRTRRRR